GTDGVLARQIRPLEASCRAMSVKVPPISTAMARAESEVMGKSIRAFCHPERSEGSRASTGSLVGLLGPSLRSGRQRVDVTVAVEGFHIGTFGAQAARQVGIDFVGLDGDAVELLRRSFGDEAAQHVVEHARRRPVVGMAVAAATTGLDAQ